MRKILIVDGFSFTLRDLDSLVSSSAAEVSESLRKPSDYTPHYAKKNKRGKFKRKGRK